MSDESEVKPIGLLYMWLLVTRGGDSLLKDIHPPCKPEYRRPLVSKGLLTEVSEGRSKRLTLTDAGWHYLATHMTSSIKTASAATTGRVLQGVLAALARHMGKNDFSLAELFSPPSQGAAVSTKTSVEKRSATQDKLWQRLAAAWKSLQGADEGIRLENLRRAFSDVVRVELDNHLLEWQKQGKIVIYPYDDGERRTPEAREAALRVNGTDLHVIYQK